MNVNVHYKDSVFSLLFGQPEVLRKLYSALEGVPLPADMPVNINTLQDVLYMAQINDLSFEIGGQLVVLIEHQSTINPNMALRLLMYSGRLYEKMVNNKDIYSRKKLVIPRPVFFVLYNGKEPFPDKAALHLSDLFEKIDIHGIEEKTLLELEVQVININEGRNVEIVRKCKELNGYSAFIAKVREYQKEPGDLETALKKAIEYCCRHDIIKEFLETHGAEVASMLMTEFNLDDAKEVWREEGREEGREENLKYVLELLDQGFSTDELKQRLTSGTLQPL